MFLLYYINLLFILLIKISLLLSHKLHRMFPEGICLSLMKDFDEILSTGKPYELLPLVRLSEINPLVSKSLSDNSHSAIVSITSLAECMLTRGADKPKPNEESLTRVGLGLDTVDSEGNRVMAARHVLSSVAQSKTNKRAKVYMVLLYQQVVVTSNVLIIYLAEARCGGSTRCHQEGAQKRKTTRTKRHCSS